MVDGDTGGVGSDDSEGVCSHKTRGEVTDPTNPVFSVAASRAQLPSTHMQPVRSAKTDDLSLGHCRDVVHKGPGVKAYKNTIPKDARALPPNDKGYEAAEASQFAGGGKSMQKPIGFRPDLAESLGTSQPLGFRPEFMGLASSSEGCRPTEPEAWLHSVGSPIHVELSESASGETLGEGGKKEVLTRADSGMRTDPSFWPREGKPELSYSLWDNPLGDTSVSNYRVRDICPMAYPEGSTYQSSGFLSPRPCPLVPRVGGFPETQGKIQEPTSGSNGQVQVNDEGTVDRGDRASGYGTDIWVRAQNMGIWGWSKDAGACLPQDTEEDRRTASLSPNDWGARQGVLSSGALGRKEWSGVDPCEAASVILPGSGQSGLVEANGGSAKGESTLFSAGSHVHDRLCPSDLQSEPPQPLMWRFGITELGMHEACEVVSSQGVSVREHVQEGRDQMSFVSGAVAFKHTLRKDLSSALPTWARARLGASVFALQEPGFCPSDSLGPADESPAGPQPPIIVKVWETAPSAAGVSQEVDIHSSQPQVKAKLRRELQEVSGMVTSVRDLENIEVLGSPFDPALVDRVGSGPVGQTQDYTNPNLLGFSPVAPEVELDQGEEKPNPSSTQSCKEYGLGVEVAGSPSHGPEGMDAADIARGPFVSRQVPRATWFSRVHVCGPQCFPPLTAKKVRAGAAWRAHIDSSAESFLGESSEVDALSPRRGDIKALPQPPEDSRNPSSVSSPKATPSEGNRDLNRTLRFSSLPREVEEVELGRTLRFGVGTPKIQGSPCGNVALDPSHKPLRFSPRSPQEQGSPRSSAYPSLGCSSGTSQEPGAINTQVATQAFASLQEPGAISNQVAAQAFANSQEPGAISNPVAAQAFAESQELGTICDPVARQTFLALHLQGGRSNGQGQVLPLGAQVQQRTHGNDGMCTELYSMRGMRRIVASPNWLCSKPLVRPDSGLSVDSSEACRGESDVRSQRRNGSEYVQFYQIHDEDSDQESVEVDPWWEGPGAPLIRALPFAARVFSDSVSPQLWCTGAYRIETFRILTQRRRRIAVVDRMPGIEAFIVQKSEQHSKWLSAPSGPRNVPILGNKEPALLSLVSFEQCARHVVSNVVRRGESPCLESPCLEIEPSGTQLVSLPPGESAIPLGRSLTLFELQLRAIDRGSSESGAQGSPEGAYKDRVGSVLSVPGSTGAQKDQMGSMRRKLEAGVDVKFGAHMEQTVHECPTLGSPQCGYTESGPILRSIRFSHAPILLQEWSGHAAEMSRPNHSPLGKSRGGIARVGQGAAVQVREDCSAKKNQGAAVKVREVREECIAKAGKVHPEQHQAGKVHPGQHQPGGQAGKVHLEQHQPEGQAGKVQSEQHQPEGQAGQRAAMKVAQVNDKVSGAVSGARLQVSNIILGVEPQVSGAPQDQANHLCSAQDPTGRSIAHKDPVSRPDARMNLGEGTGAALSPESLGLARHLPSGGPIS